ARSLVGAPCSVLRDAALRAAPRDEGGLGVPLPVKVGDKPLKRLDSWKEVSFGFRSAGFGFRSRRTLILFRLVLISFRRILNSFHASWRLERGAAWDPLRLAALQNGLGPGPAQPFEKARFAEGRTLDYSSPGL